MRTNLCAFGLILTATLGIASVPAHADEQVNTQITNQSAGAVGDNNAIYQQSDQLSIQQMKKRGGDSVRQDNLQRTDQGAAAVGSGNYIDQRSSVVNVQQHQQKPARSSYYDYYRR